MDESHQQPSVPQQHTPPQMPDPNQPVMAEAPMHTQHVATGDYPSSPITTVKESLRLLWRNGKHALAAASAVQVLLGILVVVSGFICLLAIIAAIIGSISSAGGDAAAAIENGIMQASPEQGSSLIEFLKNVGGTAMTIAIVSGVIFLVLAAYMQSIYLTFAVTTVVNEHSAKLGDILKQAFRKIWPLFGLVAIEVVAFLLISFVAGLIAGLIGGSASNSNPASIVIGVILFIALAVFLLYAALRLTLAQFAIVALNFGPIKALKYSWKSSRKKLWEILGVAGVVAVLAAVVTLPIDLIGAAVQSSSFSAAWGLVDVLVTFVIAFFAMAPLAMRFKQIKAAYESGSHHSVDLGSNVGAFAIAMVILAIVGGIQNAINPKPTTFNLPNDTMLQNYDNFNFDSTMPDLNTDESLPPSDTNYQLQ